MTPREWMRAHKVRHDEGTPTRCAECDDEVGAFEVDGTRERLGYGCLRRILAFFAPPEDVARRLRDEP